MVDVKHKRCTHESNFNYENETEDLYCLTHKEYGMVNVISKTCTHEECKTKCSFDYENETKT